MHKNTSVEHLLSGKLKILLLQILRVSPQKEEHENESWEVYVWGGMGWDMTQTYYPYFP